MDSYIKSKQNEHNKFFSIDTYSRKTRNLPKLSNSKNDSLNISKSSKNNYKILTYEEKGTNTLNFSKKDKNSNFYLNTFTNSLFNNSLPYPSIFHKNKIIDFVHKKRLKLKTKDKKNSLNKIFFNLDNFPYQDIDSTKNLKTFFLNSNKIKKIEDNKRTVSILDLGKNLNKNINLFNDIPIEIINDLAERIYLDNLNKIKQEKKINRPKKLNINNTVFEYILDNINRIIEIKNQKNQLISLELVKNLLNDEIQELNNIIQGKSCKTTIEILSKKIGCDLSNLKNFNLKNDISSFLGSKTLSGKNNFGGALDGSKNELYDSNKKEINSSVSRGKSSGMNGLIKNLYNSNGNNSKKTKKIFFETQKEKNLYKTKNMSKVKGRNLSTNQDLEYCITPNSFKITSVFGANKINDKKDEVENNINKEIGNDLKFLYENSNENEKYDLLKKKLTSKFINKQIINNNTNPKQNNCIDISLNSSFISENNNENQINKNNKKQNKNNQIKCFKNIMNIFIVKKTDFISSRPFSSKNLNHLKLHLNKIPLQKRKSFTKYLAFNNPADKNNSQNDLSKNSNNKLINNKNKEKNKKSQNSFNEKNNKTISKDNIKSLSNKNSNDGNNLNDLKKPINVNNRDNLVVNKKKDCKNLHLNFNKKHEPRNMKQIKNMIHNSKLKEKESMKEKIIKQINCLKNLNDSNKINIFKYVLNYISIEEKNFINGDEDKKKEMEIQKKNLKLIIKSYFAKLIKTAIEENKQGERTYYELYQRLDILRSYDLLNEEEFNELEKKILEEEESNYKIENIKRRFYVVKGELVCDNALPHDRQLTFNNSYLLKNRPKVDFVIKKEIIDILNDEPKNLNKNERSKHPRNKRKLLKKNTLNLEKINNDIDINDSKNELDNHNDKNNLCEIKNYFTLTEEEEREQNLRDKKLYDFFAKVQKLKNSKDLLNDDIDEILNEQIDWTDFNNHKLEDRINNFVKALHVNRVKYKYDSFFKQKGINYISPIRFKQGNHNILDKK